MDIVIPFRHSAHEDEELRYVLRSVERNFADAGKLWILGDRPAWLTADKRVVEHVGHEYLSRPFRFRLPVRNQFLLALLGSLIPGLSADYVWMSDDNVLLQLVDVGLLAQVRALDDPAKLKTRGGGLYKDALWRTIDTLGRLGYPALNYEAHIPHVMQRKWVWEAYCEFENFISEDRYYGLLLLIAVFNYRMKHEPFKPTWLLEEGKFIGFYPHGVTGIPQENADRNIPGLPVGSPIPPTPLLLTEQIRALCAGKTFLNFDDASFTIAMHQFLDEEFPAASRFERAEDISGGWVELEIEYDANLLVNDLNQWSSTWPDIIMPSRQDFSRILNQLKLTGEGVEVGTFLGEYAEVLLQSWEGKRLHCVDPWTEMFGEGDYYDINNVPQSQHEQNYAETLRRLKPFGARCSILRMTSADAATQFVDGSLDFVYLDARHDRAGVEEDIKLWAAKIRPGGILCGYNYLDGVLPSGRFEVKSAVDTWAQHQGLEIRTSGEPVWRSWFVRIPAVNH